MATSISTQSSLTAQDLLAYLEGVQNGSGDARHSADHAAQAQVDEHEEEHDRPEGAGREVGHGFGEGNEGQTRTLHRLEEIRADAGSDVEKSLWLLSLSGFDGICTKWKGNYYLKMTPWHSYNLCNG